jgi:hypothetical protein
MTGLKFKSAHERAGSEKWSATPKTQRKRMITFLESVIADLERQNNGEERVASKRRKPQTERRNARATRQVASRATRSRLAHDRARAVRRHDSQNARTHRNT